MNAFSPHTRGCSSPMPACHAMPAVFPAYAGMFRFETPALISLSKFSPHTRGCSWIRSAKTNQLRVFPAYAGMFQHREKRDYNDVGFPRIRGDVPWIVISLRPTNLFSPHTRGCSGRFLCRSSTPPVFPAYAGMFLHTAPPTTPLGRFPRIRGDVPKARSNRCAQDSFSPHTRGCS